MVTLGPTVPQTSVETSGNPLAGIHLNVVPNFPGGSWLVSLDFGFQATSWNYPRLLRVLRSYLPSFPYLHFL